MCLINHPNWLQALNFFCSILFAIFAIVCVPISDRKNLIVSIAEVLELVFAHMQD